MPIIDIAAYQGSAYPNVLVYTEVHMANNSL